MTTKRRSARLLTDLARAQTEAAVAVLVAIMREEAVTATARIAAANALLDRGWGRPRGEVEAEPAVDIAAIIAQRRRQVAEGLKDDAA